MRRLKKFRRGEKIAAFPADSWNAMASEVERTANLLGEIVDDRKPKSKSPVIVQIAWNGDLAVDPGHCVKLQRVMIDPECNASAPLSGLAFKCGDFTEGEQIADYALTMGRIGGRVAVSGTLTTRTDDNTGVVTVSDATGIRVGSIIDIEWETGSRAVAVGGVAGSAVAIDGGCGDILPVASDTVTVVVGRSVGYGIIPLAYWAKCYLTDDAHTHGKIGSPGTLLESSSGGGLRIIWKPKLVIVSEEPVPAEVWVVVSMAGGGSNIRTGRVSSFIAAMTGIAKINAGDGQIQFYDDDGVADGDPIDVINRKPEDYIVDQWADVDMSKSPPEVLWGSCATFPEPE